MDISVLNKVESPFTDDKIKELIELYMESDCNMSKFYNTVNNNIVGEENLYFGKLVNLLYNDSSLFLEKNNSWRIIGSSEKALKIPNDPKQRKLIYRLYINAKGKEKAEIVENYIKRCKGENKEYKLKYSLNDGRNDEIIILSSGDNLLDNIKLVEELTAGINLGEAPKLTGKYNNIGIGEEYIDSPIYSYTEVRLGFIPLAIQKFVLDHITEISKDNSDISDEIESYMEFKDEDISDLEDYLRNNEFKDKSYREIKENDLYKMKNNIDTNFSSIYKPLFKYFSSDLYSYIRENYDEVIPELILNYRLISEAYGISSNGVFSKETMNILRHPLKQREEELTALENEEKIISEAEALIDRQKEVKEL